MPKKNKRLRDLIAVYQATDEGYRYDQNKGLSKKQVENYLWLHKLKAEMAKELGLHKKKKKK